ncbi:hypothetical protein [Erysipelatoclostridium sp. An15]|uniref:hypothetical protein n=1 Tax=Erysipelatoclostridium sp. An15 TaxID=1965566 RepID=UPI0011787BB6|nr:hypothetical protein [Erysipelatoclostridium sp. An15]
MKYEKYKNDLSFWVDHFGEEFYDFIDKYSIDLNNDEYNLLKITQSNKTIVKKQFKTLNDFEEYFIKLKAKNKKINFRQPHIFSDAKKESVPISNEDFSPFDLMKEFNALKPLLEKNYSIMFDINESFKKLADDINFDINDNQMEKIRLILSAMNKQLIDIQNSINNDTKVDSIENSYISFIKQKVLNIYNKYSFLFIIILLLILVIRW